MLDSKKPLQQECKNAYMRAFAFKTRNASMQETTWHDEFQRHLILAYL